MNSSTAFFEWFISQRMLYCKCKGNEIYQLARTLGCNLLVFSSSNHVTMSCCNIWQPIRLVGMLPNQHTDCSTQFDWLTSYPISTQTALHNLIGWQAIQSAHRLLTQFDMLQISTQTPIHNWIGWLVIQSAHQLLHTIWLVGQNLKTVKQTGKVAAIKYNAADS